MIHIKYFDSWETESVGQLFLVDAELRSIAKQLYTKEFEKYKTEFEREDETDDEIFDKFVEDVLDDDRNDSLECIIDEVIIQRKIPAAFTDVWRDRDSDVYCLSIKQVVAQEKKDLQEMVQVYLEEQGSMGSMAEIVTDKLLQK